MSKIKIYHGSLENVGTPEIRLPNRTLDYGNLIDQLLMHTPASLKAITFVEAQEIKL